MTVFRMSSRTLLFDAMFSLARAGYSSEEVAGGTGALHDPLLRVLHTDEEMEDVRAVVRSIDHNATPVQ